MKTSSMDPAANFLLSQRSFARLSRYITERLGIKMSPAKLPMLQSRLQRRARQLEMPSLDAYCDYLFESSHTEAELIAFIDAVTTNKTDFFREPQHFEFLTRKVLPFFFPEGESAPEGKFPRGTGKLKLWCAGCSSGEEPYTLAMLLDRYSRQRSGMDFSILGTDISTRVLEQARLGIYEISRIDSVPADLRNACLLRGRERRSHQVRIIPALRAKVSFHRLNLMESDYRIRDHFHVIFFRNVMIYFEKATQEAIVNRLCRHLVTGGFLFVGHSESLSGLNVPVTCVANAVYQKQV